MQEKQMWMCVTEKQKRTSGQTRTNHQFQNMNEITDNIRKNVVFASKSRVQENKQDTVSHSTPLTCL